MLEHALEEPVLAAEGKIEARWRDPHRLGQIGQRRALIAVPPKEIGGRLYRFVDIEDPWTRHLIRSRSPSLYSDPYKIVIDSEAADNISITTYRSRADFLA